MLPDDDYCPHGISWDEYCEECEEEDVDCIIERDILDYEEGDL